MMADQRTYTVKEIAAIYEVDPETVRRWIRVGKLKVCTVGRSHRISQSELDRLYGRNKEQN